MNKRENTIFKAKTFDQERLECKTKVIVKNPRLSIKTILQTKMSTKQQRMHTNNQCISYLKQPYHHMVPIQGNKSKTAQVHPTGVWKLTK